MVLAFFFLLSKIRGGPIFLGVVVFWGGMPNHHETHLKRNSDGPKHWILPVPVSLPLDGFRFDERYDFALSPEKINKLLKFNSLPLKSDLSKRKGKRLPTIIFQENML